MVVYRGNDLIVNADGIFLMKAVDPFLLEFILIIRDHLTADVAEFLRSREFLSIDGINGIVFQFGNLSSLLLEYHAVDKAIITLFEDAFLHTYADRLAAVKLLTLSTYIGSRWRKLRPAPAS